MPHESHDWRSKGAGQVLLRFYVPSDLVTSDAGEVSISVGTAGVIHVPQTLMAESDEPDEVVFEAQMPTDVATAVRSTCEVLLGQTFIEE
jgi:hypothetical protein